MKRILINDVNAVDQVITSLKNKEIIVYPTDTIYGIGTDANNDSGIQKINGLKQRTGPMTIIIHEFEDISNKIVINPILEEQMLKIVNKLFGSTSKRHLRGFSKIVGQINQLEDALKNLELIICIKN